MTFVDLKLRKNSKNAPLITLTANKFLFLPPARVYGISGAEARGVRGAHTVIKRCGHVVLSLFKPGVWWAPEPSGGACVPHGARWAGKPVIFHQNEF